MVGWSVARRPLNAPSPASEVAQPLLLHLFHPVHLLHLLPQGLLNLYWGPLTRNVWAPLPRQRHATRGPDCFYDYFQRPIKGCKSYLLVKQTSAPAGHAAQHAAPGLFANMGWRQVTQESADDDGDDEAPGDAPSVIDHTCAGCQQPRVGFHCLSTTRGLPSPVAHPLTTRCLRCTAAAVLPLANLLARGLARPFLAAHSPSAVRPLTLPRLAPSAAGRRAIIHGERA